MPTQKYYNATGSDEWLDLRSGFTVVSGESYIIDSDSNAFYILTTNIGETPSKYDRGLYVKEPWEITIDPGVAYWFGFKGGDRDGKATLTPVSEVAGPAGGATPFKEYNAETTGAEEPIGFDVSPHTCNHTILVYPDGGTTGTLEVLADKVVIGTISMAVPTAYNFTGAFEDIVCTPTRFDGKKYRVVLRSWQ